MSENFVSDAVGALAMAFLDRTLKSGKSMTIPSLGIVIEGDTVSAIDDKARELGALMDAADLRQQLAAATQRADAAEAALRLATNSTPGKGTGVWVPLEKWTELHAQIDRFGADQWRNGNAGREPQEFLEWRREQAEDRRAAFNGGEI